MATSHAVPMDVAAGGIDESLYSRQLYVLGHEAMKKMGKSNVLVAGLSGLGVEIAKNIILGGVKSVVLQDTQVATRMDLSSQYFLLESEVGKNRAEVSGPRLAELNPYVAVRTHTGPLTKELILQFQVVVLTQSSLEEQLEIGAITHEHDIALIVADTRGLFGQIFCDFGKSFVVTDANGEEPVTAIISSITRDASGVGIVTCLDDARHGLEDGDHVSFAEVEGMTQLNGSAPRPIKYIGPYSFSIGDITGYSEYVRGGRVTQVKMPKTITFKSLAESLNAPTFCEVDFAKFDRPPLLHLGFHALHKFKAAKGFFPRPANTDDVKEFLAGAKTLNEELMHKVDNLDEKVLALLAAHASTSLAPMCAVIGGIVAQEVMKACSGKFSPIQQYFYLDSLECLPDAPLPPADLEPEGSRYDSQIAVFGRNFQRTLGDQRWFLVGAGAIGCEHLKNLAMMGLACGPKGHLDVTDMDTIERSNLNRQFLFRPSDVGKLKSEAAAAAVKVMNPHVHITARNTRVGPDTEPIYNDTFFSRIDGVCNALDNVEARRYMDLRCVFYRKPLLESGTLGTKGNTQVVLPDLTESYSSSQDPPEKSIPICTLKNFPHAIEHTLQWARDLFEGLFKQAPESVNQYLRTPNYIDTLLKQAGAQPGEAIEAIRDALVLHRPAYFADCVKWARLRFEDLFHNSIVQLLFNFPPHQMTTEGLPFWSGPKRCPNPIVFDPHNELHMEFVVAAANLRASIFHLKGTTDHATIVQALKEVRIPPFTPKSGVHIETDEKKAAEKRAEAAAEGDLNAQAAALPPPANFAGVQLAPVDFEKDDDTNFHMAFITATSNLRATNYKIEPADRHRSKLIAGKIIPAIATTTALVSGLVMLELYKVIQRRPMEAFRNTFANLALPFFGFTEPVAAAKKTFCGKPWTIWDRFDIKGPKTLGEVIKHFATEEKLTISMMSSGASMLYNSFTAKAKMEARLAMPVNKVYEEVTKKPLPPHVQSLVLEITCDDEEGNDVEVPFVVYHL
eukprot:m.224042 g.224042  ORF g.224042 m.224042 type:complete len:1016 (-) comp16384_c0_seq1:92-3139(-)